MRTTPVDIPLEVQFLIIESVRLLSQHASVDDTTLRACALVCRKWTRIAQRMLFRRLRPHTAALPRLLRTLRASPHLAEHVFSIILHIQPLPAGRPPTAPSANREFQLLKRCKYVRAISIDTSSSTGSPEPTREWWSNTLLERMQALPLRPKFLSLSCSPAFAQRLARLWPSVRALEMHAQPNGNYTRVTAPNGLESLSLSTPLDPENDLSALRRLELELAPAHVHGVWHQLAQAGALPQLRVLVLADGLPPPDVLSQFAQLKSLVFGRQPLEPVALPPRLEHVGYHCRVTEPLADAGCMFAALRALPDLQLFTVTGRLPPATLVVLEDMCRDCGVDFSVYEDLDECPRLRHVDWIQV
ncbi:hypothetical protein FA95DRAFT_1607600 [Auriscalpium vulgare]|uniref:Uncharacterized protein n=1 Tax=Auriscalpium vulgare TaxID=40419 RepID=A0ACB8RPD2_9AGAM|nr:hypothetical protein FA95DRAFT_1607600 [Auriscalpium vulgare]